MSVLTEKGEIARAAQSKVAKEAEAKLRDIGEATPTQVTSQPAGELDSSPQSEGSEVLDLTSPSRFTGKPHPTTPGLWIKNLDKTYTVEVDIVFEHSNFFKNFTVFNPTTLAPFSISIIFGRDYMAKIFRFMHDPLTVQLKDAKPMAHLTRRKLGYQMGMPTAEDMQKAPFDLSHLEDAIRIYITGVALGAPRTMRYCLQTIEDTAWNIRHHVAKSLKHSDNLNPSDNLNRSDNLELSRCVQSIRHALLLVYGEKTFWGLLGPLRTQLASVVDALSPLMLDVSIMQLWINDLNKDDDVSINFPKDWSHFKHNQMSRRHVVRSQVPTELDLDKMIRLTTGGEGMAQLSLLV